MTLVGDNKVYELGPGEFRFREACLHYKLFMEHHGLKAGQAGNRFLWMSHADAFLMALISLPDLVTPRPELHKSDTLRFLKVMRNITVHQAAVVASSPFSMVNKIRHAQAGAFNPDRPDHDDPILVAARIDFALKNYETALKTRPDGIDKKTGQPKTWWDREEKSVEAARRWNAQLAARPDPRTRMSEVFFEALECVGMKCGFALPELPAPLDSEKHPLRVINI